MAAPIRFLSGRQQQQKIGIQGSTESEKVLEVIGRVGIGTTVFEPSTELDIRGSISIASTVTATTINATNVITTGVGNTFSDLQVTGITSSSAFADFDYLQAPFGSTVTFTVTVASKDASHRYNGTGSGNAYLINGVQAPFLTLTPGRTYRFTNNNTGSHPLKFYLEADKTTEYTSGVNFQNTYTEITVGDETPVVLHYQCTAHGYMGNAIQVNSNVVNTNYAATLRGGLNVSGVSTFQSDVHFGDSDKIHMGDNDDLQIFHHTNGTGVIQNAGSGQLQIRSDEIRLLNQATDENYAFFRDDGAVELYYDNVKRFETTGYGVTVFGTTQTQQLNVTGLSTFGGNIDANGNLDVDGDTELDNLNVSGITTLAGNIFLGEGGSDEINVNGNFISGLSPLNDNLYDLGTSGKNWRDGNFAGIVTSTGLNISGIVTASSLNVTGKLTSTGIGISVANGAGNTAYIEGPSEIWIDPHPFGVGQTSGSVRIRGDLYVDGTEFIVDVDKVQLGDFRIGIATTAGTNAILDGAGLGIGSESIEKTITWNNSTSALMSSENWNLASGKHYEIGGIDVLTSTTLGSGVVNSSLTGVGTLTALTVSGDVTANGNILGDSSTNISGISSVTATLFSGSGASLTTLNASELDSGTIPDARFPAILPTVSGANLTNLDASDLASGTIPDARFPATLPAVSGASLTTLNASELDSGTIPDARFPATLPAVSGANLTGITANQVGAIASLIGDTAPQLGGNLDINNKLINGTGGINISGIVTATDFNSTSDENLKENIRTIENPLAKVAEIRGVNFDWKENQKPSVGVIAQEVEKVFPELVLPTGFETKSVNYNGLIGLLIEVVKEQQTQINSLNDRLSQLE